MLFRSAKETITFTQGIGIILTIIGLAAPLTHLVLSRIETLFRLPHASIVKVRLVKLVLCDVFSSFCSTIKQADIVSRTIFVETVLMFEFIVSFVSGRAVGAYTGQNPQALLAESEQSHRVHPVHRIIQTVAIPIRIAALVPDGIGRSPPAGEGVVVPPAEADEAQIPVVQAAREAKGQAQARVGILDDPPERVVQDLPGIHS